MTFFFLTYQLFIIKSRSLNLHFLWLFLTIIWDNNHFDKTGFDIEYRFSCQSFIKNKVFIPKKGLLEPPPLRNKNYINIFSHLLYLD